MAGAGAGAGAGPRSGFTLADFTGLLSSSAAQFQPGLITAGAAAGDLVLAARCFGALDALGKATELVPADLAGEAPNPALEHTLQEPAYKTYVSEGQAGGIDLITTLYPR